MQRETHDRGTKRSFGDPLAALACQWRFTRRARRCVSALLTAFSMEIAGCGDDSTVVGDEQQEFASSPALAVELPETEPPELSEPNILLPAGAVQHQMKVVGFSGAGCIGLQFIQTPSQKPVDTRTAIESGANAFTTFLQFSFVNQGFAVANQTKRDPSVTCEIAFAVRGAPARAYTMSYVEYQAAGYLHPDVHGGLETSVRWRSVVQSGNASEGRQDAPTAFTAGTTGPWTFMQMVQEKRRSACLSTENEEDVVYVRTRLYLNADADTTDRTSTIFLDGIVHRIGSRVPEPVSSVALTSAPCTPTTVTN